MERRGINLSYADYATRLQLLYHSKGISIAEQYFNGLSLSARSKATYSGLLYCYCTEGLVDKAVETVNKMRSMNFSCAQLSYQNLMALYLKMRQPESVQAIVQEMKEHNITVNAISYSMLIDSYTLLGDVEAVEKLVNDIESEGGVSLDWMIYSSLTHFYTKMGLFDKANNALRKLEKIIPPKRLPFHFMISLYAKTSNLVEVKRVWQCLKSTFSMVGNQSYLVMLQALDKLGDFDGFMDVSREWEAESVDQDVRIINFMINSFLRHGMVEGAEAFYNRVLSRGWEPNFRTFEMFLEFYLTNLKTDLALKWFKFAVFKAKENSWHPSKEMVDAFLKFHVKGDVACVDKFNEELKRFDFFRSNLHHTTQHSIIAAGTNPSTHLIAETNNVQH